MGRLPTGARNQITDVPGVRVGHVTLTSQMGYSESVCTGVTAILPRTGQWFDEKATAATHVINGYGKTVGLMQVNELGVIESPILLTNTLSVPAVTQGVIEYMLDADEQLGNEKGSINVVVGECNDGYLNDLRGLHVRSQHAREAIETALRTTDVGEGSVGAGAGMRCFGWKGGIGTASRRVSGQSQNYTIGALVLTNFGDAEDLTILGLPIGRFLQPPDSATESLTDGSIMIVLATDLPLDSRQLGRLARRATFGLARTGSIAHHGSGDVVIAFSTAPRVHTSGTEAGLNSLRYDDGPEFSNFFRAVVECTEEAILNSLTMSDTTFGNAGRVVYGLPFGEVVTLLEESTSRLRRCNGH